MNQSLMRRGVARRAIPLLLTIFSLAPRSGAAQLPAGENEEPLQCWWRTSSSAIRIAEPFSLLLTCAVEDSEARRVVVDQANLSPGAIPLAPFDVIGGGDITESRSANRTFFQREYRLRVVGGEAVGTDVLIPPVVISYRLQTATGAGDRTQGIERRQELPALPIRVVSLVPTDARDIREASTDTFAELEGAAVRASLLTTTGAVFMVLGTIGLAAALATAARRPHPGVLATGILPDRIVLQRVGQELAVVRRAREHGGWNPEEIARTLAALRIAAAFVIARAPSQRVLNPREQPPEGVLLYKGRGGRRTAISASVTPQTLEHFPDRPDRVAAIQKALAEFTHAQYARERPTATTSLDEALDTAERVVRELKREHGRVAQQLAAGSRWSAQVFNSLWSR